MTEPTQPNAARIYDYMIGGSHNFEVDRMAAERLRTLFPSMGNAMRLNRWFMHEAMDRLTQQSFTCYLDLASGLPTEGYLHDIAPNAKIMYNDIDPITVAYGRDILGNNANVSYQHNDIRNIDTLLATADEWFNGERFVGVSFIGVAYFLPDADVAQILQALYEWCAPGSQVVLSWLVGDPESPRFKAVLEQYVRMGNPVYMRTPEQIQSLYKQWTVLEPGLQPLTEWVEVENWVLPETHDEAVGDIAGVILQRP